MSVREKQETLFGMELKEIDILILTPIDLLFRNISTRHSPIVKGWWETIEIEKGVYVVKCPTGDHSGDVIFYAGNANLVLFAGYCGAIKKGISVGEVFGAQAALKHSSEKLYFQRVMTSNSGIIYQVSSLREQEEPKFLEKIPQEVSCIDMESYSIAEVCSKYENPVAGIYVVTDNLLTNPFYQSSKEVGNISEGVRNLMKIIRGVIDNGR